MPNATGWAARALDPSHLQRKLQALQYEHAELDPLAALVLVAVREFEWPEGESPNKGQKPQGITTALLSRKLDIEHALIRRAAAELEAGNWISTEPASAASPALRLRLLSE